METPANELTPPAPYDPIPDLVENILGAWQYVSPAHWVGWVIDQIFGTDPWQWVAEQFAGDYEAVQRAGIALKQLASFNELYKANVRSTAEEVLTYDWRGNAADAARAYFDGWMKALGEQEEILREVGDQFETAAVGVYQATQGFKSYFSGAVDIAIIAGIEAAATAATSWTGVGAVAGTAATAVTIAKGASLWARALVYHNDAWTAVQSISGISAGYFAALKGLERLPLPGNSYDHPGSLE